MARAQALGDDRRSLYGRDLYLWLEQEAALLREGHFHELDVPNLLEEIDDIGRSAKKAIKSDLVV